MKVWQLVNIKQSTAKARKKGNEEMFKKIRSKKPYLATAAMGLVATGLTLAATTDISMALSNAVKFYSSGSQTCIESNGVPNHSIGNFPLGKNPNTFQANDQKYCFSSQPQKGSVANYRVQTIGVALNGIAIRPGTAESYDPTSRSGFSRNSGSGWRLEGKGNPDIFGIDANNAHVDHRGLYHYHGVPAAFISITKGSLFGYAADGHEIHYVGSQAQPSYVLKTGTRPSGPGGTYDGTYEEDYAFASGSGNLDECNGATLDNGKYVYFATDAYPFFPRCVYGQVSSDFQGGGGGRGAEGSNGSSFFGQGRPPRPQHPRPPRRFGG